MPGPPPKRADQRRRAADPKAGKPRRSPSAGAARAPAASKDWHPIARRWYLSLAKSGQSAYYEASDWATAWGVAEGLSREYNPKPVLIGRGRDAHVEIIEAPVSPTMFTALLRAMSSLCVMEGDRRRAGIELQPIAPPDQSEDDKTSDVTDLTDRRNRLRAAAE